MNWNKSRKLMEKTVNPITKFFQLTYNIFQIRYIVNIKLKK